jgi:type VI secretion system secreted protein VgrG
MANSFQISIDEDVSTLFEVVRVAGYEGLSQPNVYEMTLLSKDSDIETESLLGKKIDIKYAFVDANNNKYDRFCSGIAVRLIRGRKFDRLYEYQVTVRSWFWLLSKKQNSRIFQDQTVLEIIESVLAEKPIVQFTDIDSLGVTKKHVKRAYCVQYQETDFNFISRLLESEGIYYWFDCHSKHGKMMLSDSSADIAQPLPAQAILKPLPSGSSEPRFNQITSWHTSHRIDSNAFTIQDSTYRSVAAPVSRNLAEIKYFDGGLENYEYPYGHFSNEGSAEGAEFALTQDEDSTLIDARFHELYSRTKRFWANTIWPDVACGSTFTFEGAKSDGRNGDYLIASCLFLITDLASVTSVYSPSVHAATKVVMDSLRLDPLHNGTIEFVQQLVDKGHIFEEGTGSKCSFLMTLLPQKNVFVPQRTSQRKVMPGPQTAQVVGAEGEELKVDKLGRVKVKFFWERDRTTKNNTSCWIRVSQPMAGQGWGGYFAPRVGQEVIVDFINGDPDMPIIVGRVYNDQQQIPYTSPTQSGFKTRSTPKGAASDYNELMFEDKKGAEVLSLHAQRNLSFTAEADQSTTVGHDQTANIKNNRTVSVGNNESNLVKVNQNNYVGGSQSSVTVGPQTNFINAEQFTKISGLQVLYADSGQEITAKGIRLKVNGFRKTEILNNDDVEILGYQTTKVAIDYAVLADGNIKLKTMGKRTDAATGDHFVMTDAKYKLLANTGIQMMTPASIDCTSMGSNTTIMGKNTSGYLGENREANMGMAVSNFIGLSLDNALGLATSNFLGVGIENYIGAKTSFCLAAMVEAVPFEVHTNALFTVAPGAPAASADAGAGISVLALIGNLMIGTAGIGSLVGDSQATLQQYEDARDQLKEAAEAAKAEGLTSLSTRLDALAQAANQRAEDPLFSSDSARSDRTAIENETKALDVKAEEARAAQGPALTDSQSDALNTNAALDQNEPTPQISSELPSAEDAKKQAEIAAVSEFEHQELADAAKEKQAAAAKELQAKQAQAKEALKHADEGKEQLKNSEQKLQEAENAKKAFDDASDAAQDAAEQAANKAADKAKADVITKAAEAFPKAPAVPAAPSIPSVPKVPSPPNVPGL